MWRRRENRKVKNGVVKQRMMEEELKSDMLLKINSQIANKKKKNSVSLSPVTTITNTSTFSFLVVISPVTISITRVKLDD